MNNVTRILNYPDAKRKLLIALIFVISCALNVVELTQHIKSITAWGSFLALMIVVVLAWPLVKDFIWPSGLEHVAATELSMACHSWKNFYLSIDPDLMNRLSEVEGEDIWGNILSASHHKCTKENVARFQALFVNGAINTQKRIDAVITRYGDVLSSELRVFAQQAMNQLRLAPISYTMFCQNFSDQAFYSQFSQVIDVLSKLERSADELQNRTKPSEIKNG